MMTRHPLDAASDNVHQWRLGEACKKAQAASAGDLIDRGLALLHFLNEAGYDVLPKRETTPFSLRDPPIR